MTKSREKSGSGIAYWMQRVLKELDNVGSELAPDPVHDLRVAIRRCRAIGEAFRELDPHPEWKHMRQAGKQVFAPLGELRDVQVMLEWLDKLAKTNKDTADPLRDLFTEREQQLKESARQALQNFDRERWRASIGILDARSKLVPAKSPVFQYMALERWREAHELHCAALDTRTEKALHQARIGIKHFRYIVENFLPDRLEQWGDDLKELQDLLGDVHDLDVLWQTARKGVSGGASDRQLLKERIKAERAERLRVYLSKTTGAENVWETWREGLPRGTQLHAAILTRARIKGVFQAKTHR